MKTEHELVMNLNDILNAILDHNYKYSVQERHPDLEDLHEEAEIVLREVREYLASKSTNK